MFIKEDTVEMERRKDTWGIPKGQLVAITEKLDGGTNKEGDDAFYQDGEGWRRFFEW